MTVLEFEAWVSDNYDELVELATQASKRQGHATDALHGLIESLIESGNVVGFDPKRLMAWFNRNLSRRHIDHLRHEAAQGVLAAKMAAELSVLGPDAYSDTTAENKRKRDRRGNSRRPSRQKTTVSSVRGLEAQWDGPMPGVARWRFQTLRDDRMFAARALRSHHDSMLAAVKRQCFGLERGSSYTEFGLEVLG